MMSIEALYLQHIYIPIFGKLGKGCLINCWEGLGFDTFRVTQHVQTMFDVQKIELNFVSTFELFPHSCQMKYVYNAMAASGTV